MSADECIAFARSQGLTCHAISLPVDPDEGLKYLHCAQTMLTKKNVMLYSTDKRLYRCYSVLKSQKRLEPVPGFLWHLDNNLPLPEGYTFLALFNGHTYLHNEDTVDKFEEFCVWLKQIS